MAECPRMEVRFTQLWGIAIFEHKHFTRQCSDTFEVWWDIYLSVCQKFTAKSVGERILKTSQHMAKLEAKVEWRLFSVHGVVLPCGLKTNG